MGVMIVVPALPEGQESDPEAVSGSTPVVNRRDSPYVGGRVHQPCTVESEGSAKEDSPQ